MSNFGRSTDELDIEYEKMLKGLESGDDQFKITVQCPYEDMFTALYTKIKKMERKINEQEEDINTLKICQIEKAC